MALDTPWFIFAALLPLVVLIFGACLFRRAEKNEHLCNLRSTTEGYITARRTQPTVQIGYSLFATAAGSWMIVAPAQYAVVGGIVGLIIYALATGLPLLLMAKLGAVIHERMPNVLSLNDFTLHRFGRIVQGYVALLTLLNMGVMLIAEYTTMAQLYGNVVGLFGWIYFMLTGVFTTSYVGLGGLPISIVADGLLVPALLPLLAIIVIYIGATFREPLQTPLPDYLGAGNIAGWNSIFTLGLPLLSATVFSEAMWQRAWAAADSKTLRMGSLIGSTLVTIVVLFFGFCGFLTLWAGIEPDNHINIFFGVLTDGSNGWPAFLVLTMAIIMNQAVVDSLQHALTATWASWVIPNKPVNWAQTSHYIINAPLFLIGMMTSLNALNMFLVVNVLTTISMLPVISGVILDGNGKYIRAFSVIMSCLTSIICTVTFGMSRQDWDLGAGLRYTFLLNNYDRDVFLVAFGTSIAGLIFWVILECFILRPCVSFIDYGADTPFLQRDPTPTERLSPYKSYNALRSHLTLAVRKCTAMFRRSKLHAGGKNVALKRLWRPSRLKAGRVEPAA